jgi:hypothetical protein
MIQLLVGKDVNMETEGSVALEAITSNRWRHSRLRRLGVYRSELQIMWISDSAVVTRSYDL